MAKIYLSLKIFSPAPVIIFRILICFYINSETGAFLIINFFVVFAIPAFRHIFYASTANVGRQGPLDNPCPPSLPRVSWVLRVRDFCLIPYLLFLLLIPNSPSKPEPSRSKLVGSGTGAPCVAPKSSQARCLPAEVPIS